MAVKAAELEPELLDEVCERVREQLPEQQAAICEAFVRQYYRWVPAQDLTERSCDDLYGAAVCHCKLAEQRRPGENQVRVYNPDPEDDGWESPHTVVEIVNDDMPFIVDSVTMELARQGHSIEFAIHPVIWVRRDEGGRLVEVLDPDASAEDTLAESVLHAEVVREPDADGRTKLGEAIERVLCEVRAAVEDWQAMRGRAEELVEELSQRPPPIEERELEEVKAFLRWLAEDHFTFLGYRDYKLETKADDTGLAAVSDSGLGIMRGPSRSKFKKLVPHALELARAPHPLVLTKANSRATIHRPAYLDYVGVKQFDDDGEVVGECRFVGLYTTIAYKASPREIPLVRGKFEKVLNRAGFPPNSHDAKALVDVLESLPRDALFAIEVDELFEIAMGVLGVGERPRVKLFVWQDPLDRFVSCLVTIPRDRYNTENRERVGKILTDALGGSQLDWSVHLSESVLARVHYIVRCKDGVPEGYDPAEIEASLVRAVRAWSDDLRHALVDEHGEERGGKLHKRYETAFPPGYRNAWKARSAIEDIARLERLASADEPVISLYRPDDGGKAVLRCKLFSSRAVFLSDVLPTFEHMGAKVVDERPFEISRGEGESAWIYDFGLQLDADDVERVRDNFEQTFLGVWRGDFEDDGLNGLVLGADLTGREITIVRVIARYLRQGALSFSDGYTERTLLGHPEIVSMLVELFAAKFDPDDHDEQRAEQLTEKVEGAIDEVPSLDQDRILRSFLSVVRATLRTNYFRCDEQGKPRTFLSLKVDASAIPNLPLPRPQFEIYVYSPRVEGVHLRGGKVARGGLRWSDRPEDFRTEILGLTKAQMVKNAMIVPVGAKGGFVVKRPPEKGDREALQEEAIACYRLFLSGLLDLTDNIEDGDVVPPERVVSYDEDDPYLVVAADKGTAGFSDIANEVSAEYGFWLGDAFASGGSHGYDHKEIGITARGGWESVKRHFRELGTDIQQSDFTAVGIGDMSGDVFGNGMLLSKHIKLVAAFNHAHVFLDPDPDAEKSFEERKRLYDESGSWGDYEKSAISEGGGVFSREEKSLSISKQAREALAIDEEELSPPDLIRAILRAPVDLLWNGGIGTYVKASDESHGDAGDKANDPVRVDGRELRCRVVGEGGNLGFTQLGRIEYALQGGPEAKGGRINTDSIDNVAGVNCSDHEVNIKVLLNALVRADELDEKQRNELLVDMTDAVAEQVLYGSYTQTQAVSLAMAQAAPMIDVHARLIGHLEQVIGLHREIEYLPTEEVISDRKAAHQGLVAPELAILMAYCKIHLYTQLLDSDVPEDPYLSHDLERYFPEPLPERYRDQMGSHRLRREIIATVVSNQLVDRAGSTFAFRLAEETGARTSMLARAYAVAREVFEMRPFWESVEALDNQVDAHTQLEMLIEGRRLVERGSRWLVRKRDAIDIEETIERFQPGAEKLASALPDVLGGEDRETFEHREHERREANVPDELAKRIAGMPFLPSIFDIVEVADATERELDAVTAMYFHVGARLELNWLRDRIVELPRDNRWQALTRAALRDDLYRVHRALTQQVLEASGGDTDGDAAIGEWANGNEAVLKRCLGMISDIKASRVYDTTTLPVALREVRNLLRDGAGTGRPE